MWRFPLGVILKYVPTGATRIPKENDIHRDRERPRLRSSGVMERVSLWMGMVEAHPEGNELPSQQGNPSHSLNTFCLVS